MKHLTTLFLLLFFSPQVNSAIIYVKPGGTGNGVSWSQAYGNLNIALQNAQAGDEIWVAQGTYKPGTTTGASFKFKNGVKMYGGFAGTETLLSQRTDATGHTTILSGAIDDNVKSNIILKVHGAMSPENLLDGFTIKGAGRVITVPGSGGAGVQVLVSKIEFRNVHVTGNTITMHNIPAPSHSDSVVGGAGFYARGSEVRLRNVNISDNTFTLTSDNSVNQNSGNGAGIFILKGKINYKGGVIARNVLSRTNVSSEGGGAVFRSTDSIYAESVQVLYNRAEGNQNTRSGGLCLVLNNKVKLVNLLFHGNVANGDGDAISFTATTATIINSTFGWHNHENVFPDPETIFFSGSNLRFDNSVFLEKIKTSGTNTLVYNNCISKYSLTGTQNNCVMAAMDFVAPQLQNYTIKACSPYLDYGDASLNPAATDLNGNPRVAGTGIDPGAIELINRWADVIYVDVNTNNKFNDGASWATAYNSLEDALACKCQVNGNTILPAQIWVAEGTYRTKGKYGLHPAPFQLNNNQIVYGGFASGASSVNDRDVTFVTRQTILSGDHPQINSYTNHVVMATDKDITAELNGFIVEKGKGRDGNADEENGGGIFVKNSKVTLKNLWVRDNTSEFYGGGIYLHNSGAVMENVKISNNTAASSGGGIAFVQYQNAVVPTSELSNVIIANNHGGSFGGGIYAEGGSAITIDGFDIYDNEVTLGGAAAYFSNYIVNMSRGKVQNNILQGGLASSGSIAIFGVAPSQISKIDNVLFAGNHGYYVSALTLYNVTAILTNCTFADNTATIGNKLLGIDAATLQIKNSIIDFPENIPNIVFNSLVNSSQTITIENSLVSGGLTPVFNQLGSVQLNTDPGFVDRAAGNYNLVACGPAVDAGNNIHLSPASIADAEGKPRIKNSIVDLGALEYQYNQFSFTQHPSGLTVVPDSNVVFAATVSAADVLIKWQVSYDNGMTWHDIPGETASTLAVNAVSLSMDGYLYRCIATDCAATVTSSTALLNIDSAAGLEQYDVAAAVVYPNPAITQITIKMHAGYETELTIHDIRGRLVYAETIAPEIINSGKGIDISGWAGGIYCIIMKNEAGSQTHKFVKED